MSEAPILLVEDSDFDAELALYALKKCQLPHPVVHARDGVEALDFLLRRDAQAAREDGNPALVLLDLKLPRVDGLEVLKRIRLTPGLADIPVLILSASSMEPDVQRATALGICGYMVKPLDLQHFIKAICQAVGSALPRS